MPYDESNPQHEEHLAALYREVFNESEMPARSEKWKTIGFQSTNPRTDFRGAGLLGLLCLRYFVQNYHEEFLQMRQNSTIYLALKSINVTHNLIVYFYLNSSDVTPDLMALRAGRKQFKRFCKFNAISKRSFFELHAHTLLYIYDRW